MASADTSSDPTQPRRFEKKTNIEVGAYPETANPSGEEFVRFFWPAAARALGQGR